MTGRFSLARSPQDGVVPLELPTTPCLDLFMADSGEEETFAELLDKSIRVALRLRSENIAEDDFVGSCIGCQREACYPYAAVLFLGACFVGYDITMSVESTAYLLRQITPKKVFVSGRGLSLMEESIAEAGVVPPELIIIGESQQGRHTPFRYYLEGFDDQQVKRFRPVKLQSNKKTAVVIFSSGTTGMPKGICLSHYTLLNQGTQMVMNGNVTSTILIFTTFYRISAHLVFARSALGGIARVVKEKFEPHDMWHLLERYKVQIVSLSPYQCHLLSQAPKPENYNCDIRTLITSGAIASEKLMLKLKQMLPNTFVYQVYGQTEVGGLLTSFHINSEIERRFIEEKPRSCGRPLQGYSYKIVDTSTGEILGPNQPGELCIKSKIIMNGYYNRDCSEAFDPWGWLRTGDLMFYDDEFCFYAVDRIKEVLKYRNWRISPNMLENILMSHPGVERAVVIGIPHESDGDHPMGLVILRQGHEDVSAADIESFVDGKVEDDREKLRAGVRIIDRIPLTSTGKIKRHALRDMILKEEI